MKTTKKISSAQFLSEVKAIANTIGQTYCAIEIKVTSNLDDTVSFGFMCYVASKTWYTGRTPNECLIKLKEACSPDKKQPISEILFEVPETEGAKP